MWNDGCFFYYLHDEFLTQDWIFGIFICNLNEWDFQELIDC